MFFSTFHRLHIEFAFTVGVVRARRTKQIWFRVFSNHQQSTDISDVLIIGCSSDVLRMFFVADVLEDPNSTNSSLPRNEDTFIDSCCEIASTQSQSCTVILEAANSSSSTASDQPLTNFSSCRCEPNWSCLLRTDSPSTMESNFITQSPSRSAEPSIQANAFHRLGDQFQCSATSYPRDQQHAP